MGCGSSKLDDLPAVALCRDRCAFLDEAIRLRYVMAQSHLAYTHSLKTVGASLNRFFDRDLSAAEPPSPVLNIPGPRKGEPSSSSTGDPASSDKIAAASSAAPKSAVVHHHSRSHSGSHLHFHSDSDSDDDVDHNHVHGDDDSASSSFHRHDGHDHFSDGGPPSPTIPQYGYLGFPDSGSFGMGFPGSSSYPTGTGTYMHMNFMRKHTTPSVSYQQKPVSPEIVRMGMAGEASPYPPSSSYYPYPPYQNHNFFNFTNNYGAAGPGVGGGYPYPYPGSSSSSGPPPIGPGPSSSGPKEPPPPPSPPRASAWEFLNPFESFEKYYPPYTAPSSRDSREVREEEGIPDLEEEDYQQEVVKEIHGDQKFVAVPGGGGKAAASMSHELEDDEDDDEEEEEEEKGDALYRNRAVESDAAAEYEVHMVDKKVVHDDVEPKRKSTGFKGGDSEVIREIQFQFERASECGNDLANILEVGKLPYNKNRKHHAANKVSSKMLHAITPSLSVVSSGPSTSKRDDIEKVGPALLDVDVEEDLNLRSIKLSSTLHKLYLWEKKLYEEVKVEEKMRILHERKCRKLKRLDETGAEAHKVDATRALVKSLSTKIRIAIQVVDKISVKINRVRDEELWPQLRELIQGLARMWRSMLECHINQCQAIGEAKNLDAIASAKHFSEAHVEATSQLQHDVINWTVAFSCWIGAQKGYVRALNKWLMKSLLYVPEETDDGIAPFSPGRIGAPPIFVICNQWSQGLDGVSEKEVLDCMRDFASSVLHLWEQDKLGMRNMMTNANKDGERRIKNLEREDQKIHKEMQALEKRMIMVSGDDNNGLSLSGNVVYQSDTSKSGSIQLRLQRIFEAMERFTANSLKVHEELLQRIEDLAQEQGKGS
ncbi:OLC1v1003582C1 [Oldenlandia corymbosa var. corymbosa]|uniref:OLC1v1003582C1 n=1 Tax=Oldenlandia corymbosa var. corymbosa TaxID=529605 RepID=A0AAV1DD45_OLDCO|nr:OLC1v1003582C1 [Oldenlandia corymbosa var. corymbosa]